MVTGSFPQFASLPTELRWSIWEKCLASAEPEVCMAWPLNLGCDHPANFANKEQGVTLPLTVDTSYSILMHICRESRRFAQDTTASGIRYRASALAGCQVPFRYFRPELDTLYFSHQNTQGFLHLLNSDADIVPKIRYIALDASIQNGLTPATNGMYRKCLALQTISAVFPQVPAPPVGEKPALNPSIWRFPQPYRRCKLVRASDKLSTSLDRNEISFLFDSSAWRIMGGLIRSAERYQEQEDGTAQALPTIKAEMFTVRESDGTWTKEYSDKEAYRNIKKPRCIPLEERGNPEETRLLDIDGIWDFE